MTHVPSVIVTVMVALAVSFSGGRSGLQAATIPIPNGSFESPSTLFVSPSMNSWRKSQKPDDYDETGGFLWDQLTGLFKNPASGAADRLDNCDGSQAVWMFAVPGVALFQDFDATDASHPKPAQELTARYAPGKSYRLSVAVLGGGGNMREGATLDVAFYFRGSDGSPITIQSTVVTNTMTRFPNNTHFDESSVTLPPVLSADPWAKHHIGIRMLSTVSPEMQGGYWDLDNVLLEEMEAPPSLALKLKPDGEASKQRLSWHSEPGKSYQVRRSTVIGQWTDDGPPQTGTGDDLSHEIDTSVGTQAYFSVVATLIPAP